MNEKTGVVTISMEDYVSLLECHLKLNALARWYSFNKYSMSHEDFEVLTGICVERPEEEKE